MKSLKKKAEKEKSKKEMAQSLPQNSIYSAFFGGLSSDDDIDLDIEVNDANDGMMCCCKPHLIHNESLKFQLLYSEEIDINQQIHSSTFKITEEQSQACQQSIAEKKLYDKESLNEIKEENLKKIVEEQGIEWKNIADLAYVNGFDMVNYKQFFIAAKKGYSILDSLIFENLQEGIVIEKHKTNDIPQIPFNKDTQWIELMGRHNEIHDLLKYLSGKQELQGQTQEKIYFIHDKDHKCSQSLAKFSVQYLQNRNKFLDGSYYLDMGLEDTSGNIWTNLCKQMSILGGLDNFVKFALDQQICLIISNCDRIIKEDLNQFFLDLKRIVQETKYLRIIILTQENENIPIQREHKVFVKQIKLDKIEQKYQVKLMYKYLQNNNNPTTQQITQQDIKDHQLFKEFQFTVDQIVDMCNDEKALDELYNQQKYQIGISRLTNDREVAKFRFEYMQKKSNFKVVKQLLYVLAFFPSGMTLNDISQLNEIESQGFNYLKNDNLTEFFEQFVEQDEKKNRMQLINVYNDENDKIYKIGLEQSIREYIFTQIIMNPSSEEHSEIMKVQEIILIYFSQLIREVTQKKGAMNNFDLFILSCKINSGIWSSQNNTEDNEDNKPYIIDDRDKYCEDQYPNIEFCLNLFTENFFIFEQNKKLEKWFSEIILCAASILVDQENYRIALSVIKKGIQVCDQNCLEKIKIKLQLMQTSIHIIRQDNQDQQAQIEKELNEIEKKHKALNLLGEVWYLRAVNNIIQMETIEKMQKNAMDGHFTSHSVEKRKLIKRDSILPQKMDMIEVNDIKDKLSKLYEKTISDFNNSIMNFDSYKDKIGSAKATFLRAQFIIDYSNSNDLSIQSNYLCSQLQKIQDDLFKNQNYQIIAESNIIQSQLNIELDNWEIALNFAKIAKKFLDQFKIEETELQQIAQHLVAKSTKNLKKLQKNLFIIAESQPIVNINSHHECFHNITSSFNDDVQLLMKKSNKQIDYKIEILNDKFLKNIDSCQVLHLRPSIHLSNYQQQNHYMSLEDENFYQIQADKNILLEQLEGKKASLQISLLILEMPNCETLANFFMKEINVDHVIYFIVKDQNHDTQQVCETHQIKNDRIRQFMQLIVLKLYKLIFAQGSNITITEMVSQANYQVKQIMDVQNSFYLEAVHISRGTEYLYDKETKNEQLETGGVFDLSPTRTKLSNSHDKLFMMPIFEKSNFLRFQQMTKQLTSNKNKIINIHSFNGVFNKKLLNEVANYLKMRYYFPKGIYWLHPKSKSFHTDLKKMFNNLSQLKQVKHEFKPKNQKIKEEINEPPMDNCLIIIDDDWSHHGISKKALFSNIKDMQEQIKDFVLVLISEDQLKVPRSVQQDLKIDSFSNQEMSMYFKSLVSSVCFIDDESEVDSTGNITDETYKYMEENIISNISGNISVLQIVCYIVYSQYNDVQLIRIEQKEKVQHKVTFCKQQQQEVKLQVANLINQNENRRQSIQSLEQNADFLFLIEQHSQPIKHQDTLAPLRKLQTMSVKKGKGFSPLRRLSTIKQPVALEFHEQKMKLQGVSIEINKCDKISEESDSNQISEQSHSSFAESDESSSEVNTNQGLKSTFKNVQIEVSQAYSPRLDPLERSVCWSSDDESDARTANSETKQFIQDRNSVDGCVRYHDIYVRAIHNNEEKKLFIFYKNNDGNNQFKTKFEIYKKDDSQTDSYLMVDKAEVKEIIIYVKASKQD